MHCDVDTKTIAKIVGRIKAASGYPIDEEKLAEVLKNSLRQLKEQDSAKYIDVIQELGDKLEKMAVEIGRLKASNRG